MNGEGSKSIRGDGNTRAKPGGGHPSLMGLPPRGPGSGGGSGSGVWGGGCRQALPAPTPAGPPVPGAAAGAEPCSAAGRAEHMCGWVFAPLGMSESPPRSRSGESRPTPGREGSPAAPLRCVPPGRAQPASSLPAPAGPSPTGPSHGPWGCSVAFIFSSTWAKLNLRNGTGRCKGTGRRSRPRRAAGLPRR